MNRLSLPNRWMAFASLLCAGALVLGRPVPAQGPTRRAARVEAAPALVPVAFEGFVLERDGAPAAGAVVVSSAGGQTLTELDGHYRLEVQVPPLAESVQLTATLGSELVVNKSIGLSSASGMTPVEPLVLAPGPNCHPRWLPTFGHTPELDDDPAMVHALAVFDDGNGPALYAGGSFTSQGAHPANRIAKWDGSTWTSVGNGILTGAVIALAVFDDGSGAALYVGGNFAEAGGVAVNHIAKWDGASWAPVGGGMSAFGFVYALTVFDDGSGPALYAGGLFTSAGGVTANRIAKWDGSSWTALGSGVNDYVYGLAGFDDGSGSALYACGSFTAAGGVSAKGIAKWDGSTWTPLGSGLEGPAIPPSGFELASFDDGSGPALYVGGNFTTAGGTAANRIAKWDGSSWSPLGSGIAGSAVVALMEFDDGSGPALCVGGVFSSAGDLGASNIAKWNGSSWAPLGSGTSSVASMAAFDDGHGPALYAASGFMNAGVASGDDVVRWNGSSWAPLSNGVSDVVRALASFDDGNGPALYAGGDYTGAGPTAHGIGKWDGSSWAPLGSGIQDEFPADTAIPAVRALETFDDGSGTALYVGGAFGVAGGVVANFVARWDGSSWSALGTGMNNPVHALAVFDDGSGPALYAAGGFTSADGVSAEHVARWNGSSWSPLGLGVNRSVNALAVFDDGNGPALYAGGDFTLAGGAAANYIAKWDGSSWSPLADGMHDTVLALTVFDDGHGAVLVSGSNGAPHYIAQWDGTDWSPLDGGMGGPVTALAVFDDGRGPAVYAGGFFATAGGLAANRIAKWDGSSWSALGDGTSGPVLAFTVFDDGHGTDLYAGGTFLDAPSSGGDSFLARWGCPEVPIHSKFRRR